MSLVKAQIPDGYATIRSRGLHRWRSQALESRPVIMHRPIIKYDSGPLFENNNDQFFGKDEVLLSSLDALPTRDDSPYAEPSKLKTMSSFKGFDSLAQSIEQVDVFAYNLMLPPLKSPQYINELNAIRSHHANEFETKSQSSNGISLYSRPDSPRYSQIDYRSSTSDSSETGSSSPTYLNHRIPISTLNNLNNNTKLADHHVYVNASEMRQLVTSKPPIKTAALQYRKSFSHASKVIYEETSFNRLNNNNTSAGNKTHHKLNGGHNSTAATTKAIAAPEQRNDNHINHYHKIHENASSELLNLDIIPKQELINKVVNGYDRRRYATLGGHQFKDRFNNNTTTSLYNLNKSTVSLSDDNWYEHYDPLDYKVGCQTMLRSKPVIPWYELAIKRDHRQSCPPFQVKK